MGITYDVARVLSDSPYIYDADVDFEEGWVQAQDPYEIGYYYMRNPEYKIWGSDFTAWPLSTPGRSNSLYPSPSAICPQHYGALLNINQDPRFWYAGTGGIVCYATMFPAASVISLPIIMNQ